MIAESKPPRGRLSDLLMQTRLSVVKEAVQQFRRANKRLYQCFRCRLDWQLTCAMCDSWIGAKDHLQARLNFTARRK